MNQARHLLRSIAQSYSYSLTQLPLSWLQLQDLGSIKAIQALTMNDAMDELTDAELLEKFRSGDRDASLQLYCRYSDRLFRLAMKNTSSELSTHFDPEDIVQSVFRTFFRRAASGQYEAPEGDELWKLLLVMALNKVRTRSSYHRASKRDIRKTHALVEGASFDVDRRNEEARQILQMSVDEIIEKQPESHRGILRMRIDGIDIETIAAQERRSKRTVERVLQSFRSQLMESALVTIGERAP